MEKSLVFGILLIACFSNVLCAPYSDANENSDYQGDDYDYDNDEQSPPAHHQSHHTGSTTTAKPYFSEPNVTVAGIEGKDIILECDAKNLNVNVILWYKGTHLIATGKDLLSKGYKFSPNNPNNLIILAATEESQGDYNCDVEPQNVRKNFHVIVGEHSMEVLIPESSKSSASTSSQVLLPSLLVVSILLTLLKR